MLRLARGVLAVLVVLLAAHASAQDQPPATSRPVLQRLSLQGSTVFATDDVAWLLHLRSGSPLPAAPAELAQRLTRLYQREGYTAVQVTPAFDDPTGTLTLSVDEARIDDLEFRGATPGLERRFRAALETAGVRTGEPYNGTAAQRALRRVTALTNGAFRLGDVDLERRGARRVLVVPVRKRDGEFGIETGTEGREDLFSPVDGFSPGLGFQAIKYDRRGFNYTLVSAFASWKFGRDDAGYSFGVERPLLESGGLFLGTELHDLTASDDLWRISTTEQTIAALGVKRSFRDYYRRRGVQVFAGARPSPHHELVASLRWDQHLPLDNASDFSLFRRDAEFRENPRVADAELHALVLAYTFDSRRLDRETLGARYGRHLVDDLFRNVRRGGAGWRADWTSELAGGAFGGDHEFKRHVLNVRGAVALAPHHSLAARALFGWSDGQLPIERQFAIGGLGSVRGHAFKSTAGTGMTLLNGEYALDLEGNRLDAGGLRLLLFVDAGSVRNPVRGADGWITGVGVGAQAGPVRFEWAFDPGDGPGSGQLLVRLGRGF